MAQIKVFPLIVLLFMFVNESKSDCLECDIEFLTSPTSYAAKENKALDLECYIDKYPSDLVITWRKGRTLLATDRQVFRLIEI